MHTQAIRRGASPVGAVARGVLLAALFTAVMMLLPHTMPKLARIAVNTVLLAAFVGHIVYHDFPLSGLPVVGKYFRKR